jgi:hypothetical protein
LDTSDILETLGGATPKTRFLSKHQDPGFWSDPVVVCSFITEVEKKQKKKEEEERP